MKVFLYRTAVAVATFAPVTAFAHPGHETESLLAQVMNAEHALIYALPFLLCFAVYYLAKKHNTHSYDN